ncbi:hypothetical protein [Kribbella deserti]|uniref:DUF3459 domain-containing protein n=1 Tax=Kribbella deserti TaxID=1926257 RepID=A0ABV6QQ35_9ACTN
MFPTRVPDFVNQDQLGTDATPADNNFDREHPLYKQISALASYTRRDPIWKRGNQVLRHTDADVVAFSRIAGTEYLVLANSSNQPRALDVPVGAAGMTYDQDWPVRRTRSLRSLDQSTVQVTVPALSAAVYRSRNALPPTAHAPAPRLSVGGKTSDGRTALIADVPGVPFAQATFAARVEGQSDWTHLGTDDAGPYRVYPDLTKLPGAAPDRAVRLRVVIKDSVNRLGVATLTH